MSVFERIKYLTKKHSKTMKQVTTDLGFSENYFYSLKSGKQPSAQNLQKIADYFSVTTDFLLGRSETTSPSLQEKGNESITKQIMMRMNTVGLTESEVESVEQEVERFLKWRLEEIKKEKKKK